MTTTATMPRALPALEYVAATLKQGSLHPTQVLNVLIDAENAGGLCAVRQLERRLTRCVQALDTRLHPQRHLAHIWLEATRAYLVAQAEHKRQDFMQVA